jgi:hypothetical protein
MWFHEELRATPSVRAQPREIEVLDGGFSRVRLLVDVYGGLTKSWAFPPISVI